MHLSGKIMWDSGQNVEVDQLIYRQKETNLHKCLIIPIFDP